MVAAVAQVVLARGERDELARLDEVDEPPLVEGGQRRAAARLLDLLERREHEDVGRARAHPLVDERAAQPLRRPRGERDEVDVDGGDVSTAARERRVAQHVVREAVARLAVARSSMIVSASRRGAGGSRPRYDGTSSPCAAAAS